VFQFGGLKANAGSSVLSRSAPRGHADVTENRNEI
jgi:hypothetical protein